MSEYMHFFLSLLQNFSSLSFFSFHPLDLDPISTTRKWQISILIGSSGKEGISTSWDDTHPPFFAFNSILVTFPSLFREKEGESQTHLLLEWMMAYIIVTLSTFYKFSPHPHPRDCCWWGLPFDGTVRFPSTTTTWYCWITRDVAERENQELTLCPSRLFLSLQVFDGLGVSEWDCTGLSVVICVCIS